LKRRLVKQPDDVRGTCCTLAQRLVEETADALEAGLQLHANLVVAERQ
jgi:hypothetical protein